MLIQTKKGPKMLDAPQIQGLSSEDAKTLFNIKGGFVKGGFGEDRKDCKKTMDIINKHKDRILDGLYNTPMPCGNTYFHALIANDMPYKTLRILQTIDEWVGHDKGQLAKRVPFSHPDGYNHARGKLVEKNFLMLAIAKNYEPLKNLDGSVTTCQDVYDKISHGMFPKDKMFNHSYFTTYHEDDTNLIKWLIEKAPDNCIYQKDGEGYNLIDYAFMKMDIEILAELLKRGGEKLLNESKLLNDKKLKNFAYKDAVAMIDRRYPHGSFSSLIDGKEWYSRKAEIESFLEKYNEELKKNNSKEVLDGIIKESVKKRQEQKDELLNLEKIRFSKQCECCCAF